jgi:hypothetical protein
MSFHNLLSLPNFTTRQIWGKKPLINYSKSHTCCDFCKILIDLFFLKDKIVTTKLKKSNGRKEKRRGP